MLAFPSSVANLTKSTEKNKIRVSKGSTGICSGFSLSNLSKECYKRKSVHKSDKGFPIIQLKRTNAGMTKSEIWIVLPTAMARAKSTLFLYDTRTAEICSAAFETTARRIRPCTSHTRFSY